MKVWLLYLTAYLLGSMPFAYWMGRLRGVDIRRVGTRNVGGANLWRTVGRSEAVVAAVLDISKGAAAVLLARHLGLGQEVAAWAGLFAVIGHDYSLFLRFQGGRGMGTSLGVMLALVPREAALVLIPYAIGFFTTTLALGVAVGMVLLPVLTWAFGEPWLVTAACAGMAVLMAVRRLTAIGVWQEIQQARDKRRLILNRLLYDNSQGRGFPPAWHGPESRSARGRNA